MDYFELAQASSMRMCLELQKKFPDFRKSQLELMMYLCLVAYNSEIYDGVCGDAWLRTTVTLKNDNRHRHHVFCSGSPELKRLTEAEISHDTVLSQASWEWLQRELSILTSRIEICSNILPRGTYRDRLQERLVQHQSFWTRVQSSMLWRTSCCVSRRGFFPITVINQAREKDVPLKQKVKEWMRNGGRCDLATHLMQSSCHVVPQTVRIRALRNIKRTEVAYSEEKDFLGGGAAANVYKVSWRNGTYAMKSYFNRGYSEAGIDPSQNEREVASRVLHPHIVHGFGYFEADGECHLLMEVLQTTLFAYAVERARKKIKPLFSRSNTFDVLLQIASAMEHLHLNELVHGDLKPENILLDSFEILGNERHFLTKVTDFGEAQFIVPGRAFSPIGGGTTKYAAPELLMFRDYQSSLGRTNSNGIEIELTAPKKVDVYSFGGVAHEVLTGYPVYYEHDVPSADFKAGVISGKLKPSGTEVWRNSGLEDGFPPELIKLVERCWELRPEDRPSFFEIRAVLEKCKFMVKSEVSISFSCS